MFRITNILQRMSPEIGRFLLLVTLNVQVVYHPALAHTGIAVTIPDHDAILSTPPSQLVFEFMTNVTITNIRLEINAGLRSGEQLQVRLPRNSIGQSTAYGKTITLDLPHLDAAAYLVTWQAISEDGHILVDDLNFTVSE